MSIRLRPSSIGSATSILSAERPSPGSSPSAALVGPVARPLGAPTFLSHAQERLWILDQVTDELTAYNAGRLLRFRGPLDTARLEAALSLVVAHHDVLRTHVVSDSGAPRADVADSMAFELEQQDVSTVDDPESAALGLARDLIGRHFDLANDCLLRALLVRIGPDDHLLALCVHHIASDGTSREILLADLRPQLPARDPTIPSPLARPCSTAMSWHGNARRVDGPTSPTRNSSGKGARRCPDRCRPPGRLGASSRPVLCRCPYPQDAPRTAVRPGGPPGTFPWGHPVHRAVRPASPDC